MDMADLIPELAPLALRTTVLAPAAGSPGVRDSSAGGPLLWPAGEGWPHCEQPRHWLPPAYGTSLGRVPMVPVLQLFARDVPELEFPPGKDVLQLAWCTLNHPEEPQQTVLPRLYWRTEAEVLAEGVLLDVPVPQEGECDEEFRPERCAVFPTALVEYPNWDMPKDVDALIRPRIEEAERQLDAYYTDLACALRTKVGGYPPWNQPPNWPHCDRGHRMQHLLSITGDGDLDMDMGDMGGVYLFLCRECPELPYGYRYDC